MESKLESFKANPKMYEQADLAIAKAKWHAHLEKKTNDLMDFIHQDSARLTAFDWVQHLPESRHTLIDVASVSEGILRAFDDAVETINLAMDAHQWKTACALMTNLNEWVTAYVDEKMEK